MHVDKESLMLFGGRAAIAEMQKAALQEGEAKGEARRRVQEREQIIMNIRRNKGHSAELIADITGFHEYYVQSVIDKFEKKA